MANGDAAAAAGMEVVPGTADARNGYDEINKSRDYIANHMIAGTHDASAIATGRLVKARLPYDPVQNGGFAGVTGQGVQLGWNGVSRLIAAIDGVVIGAIALVPGPALLADDGTLDDLLTELTDRVATLTARVAALEENGTDHA